VSYDGGPAFPTVRQEHEKNESWLEYTDGMTLRDYFAAKAMAAIVDKELGDDEIAKYAYDMADAMLKARDARA
jgi:hypothetical protein